MVKLIVERRRLAQAFAIKYRQRAKGTRLVDVAAITVVGAFGDQTLVLPQVLGGKAIDGFFDPVAEGIVFVGRGAAPSRLTPIRRCWQS